MRSCLSLQWVSSFNNSPNTVSSRAGSTGGSRMCTGAIAFPSSFKIMLCKIIHVYTTFLIFLTDLARIGRLNTPHFPFKTPKARSTSFLAASCCLLNFFSFIS
ncbi:hypothetical protein Hanom_Chr01g00013821 [Helianthus anomalus]